MIPCICGRLYSVQSLSRVQLFVTHGLQHARLPCPSPTPRACQTHVHRVGNAIQPSRPLLSPSPPAVSLSRIRVFSTELGLCIRWPKYWSFIYRLYCYPPTKYFFFFSLQYPSPVVCSFLYSSSVYSCHLFLISSDLELTKKGGRGGPVSRDRN